MKPDSISSGLATMAGCLAVFLDPRGRPDLLLFALIGWHVYCVLGLDWP